MSDSRASTLLLSPGPTADEVLNQANDDVFAWLRPLSETARTAFSASVNRIFKKKAEQVHTRRFLHVSGRGERTRSPFTEDDGDPGRGLLEWVGAFKLSLKVLPLDPAQGWYMGTNFGRQAEEIDLLLAPPNKTWANRRIASKHARLYIHDQSYRMMIQARHTVTIAKNGTTVLSRSDTRVIEDGELIVIGECTYVFQYTDLHSAPAFEQSLIRMMKERIGPQWSPNRLIMPSSTGIPVPLGKYWCSPSAFAQGTYGKVSAAFTLDGLPVAIKVFKNPNEADLRSHKTIMEYIGDHPNLVQLRESEFHFDTKVQDAYCVYSPLATASLSHLLGVYEFDLPTKLILMNDYLKGLSFLHQKGIMHRDVNPNNLTVTSLDNPIGIIIDLDSATSFETSTDHMVGTVAYLAPEIVSLKRNESGTYDKAVDVWALGLSMFAIHIGQRLRWTYCDHRGAHVTGMVNKQSHEAHQQRLNRDEDQANAAFLDVIKSMTEYDVGKRISSVVARAAAENLSEGCSGKIELKSTRKRGHEE